MEYDNAENTDYVPFQQNGEIITGYFEYEGGYNNPYVHTANDLYANMDPVYVFNIGKAAIGAVQHFAVASKTSLEADDTFSKSSGFVDFYPNPASKVLNLKIDNNIKTFKVEITDVSGKHILNSENQSQIDITSLKPGVYFARVISADQQSTTKIIVQ